MMYFRVNYRWADETVSNVRNDLQVKLMDSRTIGALDNNADNKVQIDELTGTMASVKPRFADLDLNKDGVLDEQEIAAAATSLKALDKNGDGRITPEEALVQSSSILKRHFEPFYGYDENAVEFTEEQPQQSQENQKLKKLLNMSVNEIELSVRAANCLNNANITTVGQLAQKSESEMLKYRNFGKKSLNEIKDKLHQLQLSLGMKFEPGLVDTTITSDASLAQR
jgi:hypothetical protein